MSTANDGRFIDAVEWARMELCRNRFGEVRLVFIVHDGRVTRVEKTVTLKELSSEVFDDGRK